VPTLAAANKNALEIIVRSTTDENGEPRPIRRAALYDSVPLHFEPAHARRVQDQAIRKREFLVVENDAIYILNNRITGEAHFSW